ncbi:MAG: 3-phosphoglycerate dehydrogenase family protein [Bacillota bacterium]|nr:3-phosphoglycerate dehydrogenase family protein [Bacillota bacterium]
MYKIGTLNKISPKGLAKLGDNYKITDVIEEADGILVRSFKMHDMKFSQCLKAIARAGAGVNNIPLDRCAEEGIVVFNTPGANANAVKELVFAAMFAEARNLVKGVEWVNSLEPTGISEAVEKGKSNFAGTELAGKKIAVIGLGAIGVSVANTASDLGMNVVGYDPYMSVASALHLYSSIKVTGDMDELLADADYVTVHIPALANTKGMINAETFAKLTKPVKLLNFSRAEIVNADDLEAALAGEKISVYITDFPTERFQSNPKIMNLPHLGASTEEAEENCAMMAAEEISDYLENGNIRNSVNFPACSMGTPKAAGRIAVIHKNTNSGITAITGACNDLAVKIENMTAVTKGDYAYTLLDLDRSLSEEEASKISFEGLISVRVIK